MSFKHVFALAVLVATLGAGSTHASAQSTPPAPRPAQPPPADPAKPAGPPEGKMAPPRPVITIGAPSGGAAKATPAKEEAGGPAASFIKDAGHDSAMEIELAKLAESRAVSAGVRAYAQMLVADHEKANEELTALATSKNVTISTDPTPTDKAARKKLDGVSGAKFDDTFINMMVEDHEKAVQEFTAATANADPDVKTFVQKMLPILKHHLEEAQKLAKGDPFGT
jgi:putative membrane protein